MLDFLALNLLFASEAHVPIVEGLHGSATVEAVSTVGCVQARSVKLPSSLVAGAACVVLNEESAPGVVQATEEIKSINLPKRRKGGTSCAASVLSEVTVKTIAPRDLERYRGRLLEKILEVSIQLQDLKSDDFYCRKMTFLAEYATYLKSQTDKLNQQFQDLNSFMQKFIVDLKKKWVRKETFIDNKRKEYRRLKDLIRLEVDDAPRENKNYTMHPCVQGLENRIQKLEQELARPIETDPKSIVRKLNDIITTSNASRGTQRLLRQKLANAKCEIYQLYFVYVASLRKAKDLLDCFDKTWESATSVTLLSTYRRDVSAMQGPNHKYDGTLCEDILDPISGKKEWISVTNSSIYRDALKERPDINIITSADIEEADDRCSPTRQDCVVIFDPIQMKVRIDSAQMMQGWFAGIPNPTLVPIEAIEEQVEVLHVGPVGDDDDLGGGSPMNRNGETHSPRFYTSPDDRKDKD